MHYYEVVGQGMGIIAMVLSACSFQMKTHKKIMIMQMITALVFSVHFLMIGAITAATLNAAAIVRDVVFYHKDKKIFSGNMWTIFFSGVMAMFGLLSWEGPISIFMTVGMVVNTLSFSFINPQSVRKTILVSSPLMLIYNIGTGSLGGMFNETMAMISSAIALVKYKKK